MGRMEKKRIIQTGLLLIRLVIGGLFVYAGAIKVLNPASFSLEISHYRLLSPFWSSALAVYLPWLEIICGVLVIFRKRISSALSILFVLVAIYMIALGSAWSRGLDISCGCFGNTLEPANYMKLMARDVLFLILIATQMLYQKRSVKL